MLRTYSDALRGFRRRTTLTIALFALSGLTESIAIATLLPFLQGTLQASDEAFGGRTWFGLEGRALAGAALVALVVLGMSAAALRYLADTMSYRLQTAVEESLKIRITEALLGMRWTAFLKLSFGDLTKAVLTEGSQVGAGVQGLVLGVGSALIAAVFLAIAAAVSVTLTLVIVAFGVITAAIHRIVARRAEEASERLSTQAVHMTELVTDVFGNTKFYRSTGQRDQAVAKANQNFAKWRADQYRILRYQPITRSNFDVLGIAFIGGILAFSLFFVASSAVEVIVLVALFYRLAPKVQLAQQGLLIARSATPWWLSWKGRLDAAEREADRRGGHTALHRNPKLTACDVGFTFPNRDTPALSSVCWELRPGECLAIVGESGSGKTTMLDLITGLLQPTMGSIRLDGIDLEDVELHAWQRRIGLVMQDSPLSYGSILENIAWEDASPDRAKAMRCAEMANIAELILSIPDGLDAQVGHRGSQLSGGQRQRIALARALYHDPWLLLLDEATSALDARSEHAIQDALRSLKGSCSLILVAHRIKTVEMADRIVVLAHGRVVEEGSWSDLVQRDGGVFRRMVLAQEAVSATNDDRQ